MGISIYPVPKIKVGITNIKGMNRTEWKEREREKKELGKIKGIKIFLFKTRKTDLKMFD